MKHFTWALISIMMVLSCQKTDSLIEDCQRIEDKKGLSKKDLESICTYNFVYTYNNETYTVCECCDCDKVPMAVDCNGEQLCDWGEDCMIDFFEEAELIGYVEF